jgi:hypothetical protein
VTLGLTCGTVGVIVAWHQPGHPMGWILIGVADFFSLDGACTVYNVIDYRHHHGTLPLGSLSVAGSQSWAPALVLFGLAFLVYPDGGGPSSRWRWVIRAYLVVGAAWTAGAYATVVGAVAAHDVHIGIRGDLTSGQNAAWRTPSSPACSSGCTRGWCCWPPAFCR